jgi:hypothetical protein
MMPRGIPVDPQFIRAKLLEVKSNLEDGAPSKAAAVRAAGISVSNFTKWSKRFPQLVKRTASRRTLAPHGAPVVEPPAAAAPARKKSRRPARRSVSGLGPAPASIGRTGRMPSESAELKELRALVVEQALENRALRRQMRR